MSAARTAAALTIAAATLLYAASEGIKAWHAVGVVGR